MTWLLIVVLVAAVAEPRIAFEDGRGEVMITGLASEAECNRVALALVVQMERAGFTVSTRCTGGT